MFSNTSRSKTSNKIATCTWEIKNFSQFNTGYQCSSNFSSGTSNKFYLRCYSKVAAEDLGSFLLIYLKRSSHYDSDYYVKCRLAILNSVQEKCFPKQFTVVFRESDGTVDQYLPFDGAVYFLNRAHILDQTSGLLQNDTLTVYCEVEVLDDQSKNDWTKNFGINDRETIIEDLSTLLESGKFSDVRFVIGNNEQKKKEFRLHKNILATRCEVFNAMMTSDCEEKRQNRVEITDVSVPVFEEMIRYIYTGKTSQGLELYAEELFVAADKYQLDFLKNKAAHELASKLSIDPVSSVLLLADMHSAEKLKTNCIKYITQNSKEVMQTETWKNLIETRIDLMVLLYRDISNSK